MSEANSIPAPAPVPSDVPKAHNPWIDRLAELVGQEKAREAFVLADKARAHTAALLREATEAVDPREDQRARVAELEAQLQAALDTHGRDAQNGADLQAQLDQATATVGRRDDEIAVLNAIIEDQKVTLSAYEAAAKVEPEPAPVEISAAPEKVDPPNDVLPVAEPEPIHSDGFDVFDETASALAAEAALSAAAPEPSEEASAPADKADAQPSDD